VFVYEWQKDDRGERIDKILAHRLDISRTQLQRWIESGLLKCGDEVIDAKFAPKPGDILSLQPPAVEPSKIEAVEKDLDILFEDKHLLVLNKKSGDVVHPGAGNQKDTLVSALLHHCKGELSGIGGVERPGIVHRLDKETSGILVIAKNDAAHQELSRQFHDREVQKVYLAWLLGEMRMPSGHWKWNIGRNPIHRQKMRTLKTGGREAWTEFKVVKTSPKASLVEIYLHTGRTHQIRVHAVAAGHPVLGDKVYGRVVSWLKNTKVERQLLHAWKIGFKHPITKKSMEFLAPIPDDFKLFERYLNP
jgi:23S rRNA pseudouridine1911/1915/1917 synthase